MLDAVSSEDQLRQTLLRDDAARVLQDQIVQAVEIPGRSDKLLSEAAVLVNLPVHIGPSPPETVFPGRLWIDTSEE
jgi:hypothetical protein